MKTLIKLAALAALTLQAQTPAPAKAEPTATTIAAPAKKVPKPNADGTVQIEISLGELAMASRSLDKLFALDLPIKTALGLSKTLKAVRAELEGFEEQRLKLVKKHSNSRETSVPPENMEAFLPDYNTLVAITVKLTITQVSLSVLGDAVKLSANDIARLESFLSDGPQPKTEEKKEQ